MFGLGFGFTIAGMFLLDCAVQNRPVVATIEGIIADPSNMRAVLAAKKGTAYAPTPAPANGAASGASYAGGGTVANVSTGVSNGPASGMVTYARAQIGKPYQWGATGPNAFDCSGLVQAAAKSVGISLPRVSQAMMLSGSPVSKANLQPGDLVFPDAGHVQIYSGNGNIIEAPHAGAAVREVAMWGYLTARRVTGSAAQAPVSGGLAA